jgi:hypothetical protein
VIVQLPRCGSVAVQVLAVTAVFVGSSRSPVRVSTIVPLSNAGRLPTTVGDNDGADFVLAHLNVDARMSW